MKLVVGYYAAMEPLGGSYDRSSQIIARTLQALRESLGVRSR